MGKSPRQMPSTRATRQTEDEEDDGLGPSTSHPAAQLKRGLGRPRRAQPNTLTSNEDADGGRTKVPKQTSIGKFFPATKGGEDAGKPTTRKAAAVSAALTSVAEVPKAVSSKTARSKSVPRTCTAPPADKSQPDIASTLRKRSKAKAVAQAEEQRGEPASSQKRKSSAAATASESVGGGSPVKASKHSTGSKGVVRQYSSYTYSGEEYKIGDDVYTLMSLDPERWPDDEHNDFCVICEGSNNVTNMLECDGCLGAFHMKCLKPKLKSVPPGIWLCDGCAKGCSPANRKPRNAVEKFLFATNEVGLGRITGFVHNRDGDGCVEVLVRYYCRPEDTHMGRQKHHNIRDVFLTQNEHYEPLESLWGPALVCRPNEWDGEQTTDVYFCEYAYHDEWKRFRRLGDSERVREEPNRRSNSAPTATLSKAAAKKCTTTTAASAMPATTKGKTKASSKTAAKAAINLLDSDEDAGDGGAGMSSGDESSEDDGTDADYRGAGIECYFQRMGIKRTAGIGKAPRVGARSKGANRSTDEPEGSAVEMLPGQGASVLPTTVPPTPLALARRALALSAPTNGLPGREEERLRISNFVEAALAEGVNKVPGVLYICGVPGTGKTACMNEVLNTYKTQAQQQGVQLVTLNALQLPTPHHVYSKLWEKMTGQRCGPSRALQYLEATFAAPGSVGSNGGSSGHGGGGGKRCMTLLLVDEIDVLITKDQAVLYNLFEWPMRAGARLAVVGISNTHDLDSRVLPRIASRLGNSKLAFQPYSIQQLQTILHARLQGSSAVHVDAITLTARKVANISGDVRRALELLRRATELAEADQAAAAVASTARSAEVMTSANFATSSAAALSAAPRTRALRGVAVTTAAVVASSANDVASGPPLGVVTASHVNAATSEMFRNVHSQLLSSMSVLEKLLLTALLLEMRATKKESSTLQAVHHRLTSHLHLLTADAKVPSGIVTAAAMRLAVQRLLLLDSPAKGLHAAVTLNVPKDDVIHVIRQDDELAAVHSQLG